MWIARTLVMMMIQCRSPTVGSWPRPEPRPHKQTPKSGVGVPPSRRKNTGYGGLMPNLSSEYGDCSTFWGLIYGIFISDIKSALAKDVVKKIHPLHFGYGSRLQ